MRAFITGMTGFVGGHLVASLLADGAEVDGTLLPGAHETAPAGTTGHEVAPDESRHSGDEGAHGRGG